MGSDWRKILRFSELGHQSRFDGALPAVWMNGHFASLAISSLSFGRLDPPAGHTGPDDGSRLLASPRKQARHPPLIQRLAFFRDARSAQRVLGRDDGLGRSRR